jgi:hypothetical protein
LQAFYQHLLQALKQMQLLLLLLLPSTVLEVPPQVSPASTPRSSSSNLTNSHCRSRSSLILWEAARCMKQPFVSLLRTLFNCQEEPAWNAALARSATLLLLLLVALVVWLELQLQQ